MIDDRDLRWGEKFPLTDSALIFGIFLAALAVRLGYLLKVGDFRPAGDTQVFIRTCVNLEVAPLLGQVDGMVGAQYAGFLLPFCTVYLTFGLMAWGYLLLLISALTPVLIYLTGRELFDSNVGLVAAFLQIPAYDAFRWTQELMTEPLFLFAVTLSFWRIAVYVRTRTTHDLLVAGIATGWMALTRPFGIPFVITGGLLYLGYHYRNSITQRSKTAVVSTVVVLGTAFGIGVTVVYPDFLPKFWGGGFVFWRGEARPGVLLPGSIPSQTFVEVLPAIVNDAIYVAVLLCVRLLAFFHPVNYFWSPSHTLHFLYTIYYLPLLVLFFLGSVAVYKRHKVAFVILSSPIIATLVITLLLFVERRFRYRAPLFPSFVLFAAYFLVTYYRKTQWPDNG